MDVDGAKALKRRLGATAADEALPVTEPVDIPADAPPVYHWTGKMPSAADATTVAEDAPAAGRVSLFGLLSLRPH